MPNRRAPLVLLLLLLVASAAGAGDWRTLTDHWYVLELNGTPAGYMRETVETDGDAYRTSSQARMRFSRGATPVSVETRTVMLEKSDGTPVRMDFDQKMSREAVESSWTFTDTAVQSASSQGGRTIERELPLPQGEWLMPMAAQRHWLEQFESGATRIGYAIVDPEQGIEPVEIRSELVTRDGEFEFGGRTLATSTWRTTTSVMPGIEIIETVTEDGYLVHDEVDAPFGKMTTRLTTREEAEASLDGAAPELLVSSFVAVDEPVHRARETTTSRMRVSIRQGTMPELPSTGAQRVEMGPDGRSATIIVDLHHPLPAAADDATLPIYVESTTMVDKDHALIRKLAKRATGRAGEAREGRADAMRDFVHDYISRKGFETAFATASETARLRAGDCSEHAVLLCALLRADGIPARVATGLVYADEAMGAEDFFGWHMWTQALIDGHWIDFDATLPARYDALHVLTGTSSLNEAQVSNELGALLTMMNNIEIDIVDVGYEEAP